MQCRIALACVAGMLQLGIAAGAVRAAEWPQWRGPHRDGQLAGPVAAADWPAKLAQRWKVAIGLGHSAPLVDGQRVYCFSRQGDDEVLTALDRSKGTLLWAQRYPAPYEMNSYARGHGLGPKSTPLLVEGRLFTLGIGGILSGWDADSGRRLWRHDFAGEFKTTSPLYGAAMSPVFDGRHVIAHVGGQDQGALLALDPASGAVRWRWTADGPAYTSPILVDAGGRRQIVTQSQKACIGIAVDDGRTLWSIPYETDYVQNIITPVAVGPTVIFSGINKGVTAYRLDRPQAGGEPPKAWHTDEVSFYMSSPVLAAGRLFGLAHGKKGQFVALDPASGKVTWSGPGRAGQYASLVAAGSQVLALTEAGELTVWKAAGDEFQRVARYEVATTPTWAHLTVAGKELLVKDLDSLAVWQLP